MDFKDTIEWYDSNANEYASKTYANMSSDSVDWFMSKLSDNPRILDAGCGPGKHAGLFLDRGAVPVGLDISIGLLGEARKRNPGIEFIQGSFLAIPFADRFFDGVFATASLVHLETKEEVLQALKEFNRVLPQNGLLFVKVKLQTGDKETEVVSDSLSGHERFFRYYTQEGLNEMLKLAGFLVTEQRFVGDKYGREEVKWVEILATKAQ